MKASRHNLIELALFGCLAVCVHHARGSRSRELALLTAGVYGFVVEYIVYVVIERVQPRLYDHEDKFALMVYGTGIPLYIVALWQTFLYVSHLSAERICRGQWARTALVAALLAISLDATMEPCAMAQLHWKYHVELHNVRWTLGPTWNGAPVTNLIAWAPMQIGFSLAMLAFPRPTALHVVYRVFVGVGLCFTMFAGMTPVLARTAATNLLLAVAGAGLIALLVSLKSAGGRSGAVEVELLSVAALWQSYLVASIAWQPASHLEFSKDQVVEIVLLAALSLALFSLVCLDNARDRAIKDPARRKRGRGTSKSPAPRLLVPDDDVDKER